MPTAVSFTSLTETFTPNLGYWSTILLSSGTTVYGYAYNNDAGEIVWTVNSPSRAPLEGKLQPYNRGWQYGG